jgi:hypothetical protein
MTPVAMTWFWQGWLAAIVFIFPIPHTIALRNLLLLVGLLAVLATLRTALRRRLPPNLKPAAWGLLATTAWLVFQSLAVAQAPTVALDNLRGDWILPLLTAALASFAAARAGPQQAIRATVAALVAHMLWVFGWQIWLLAFGGPLDNWSSGIVPFGERDYQSSLNGFLFSILLAERVAVKCFGTNAALASNKTGWMALAVSLIADASLRVRNGTIVNVVLLLVATVWMSRRQPRLIFLLLFVALLGGTSLALDSRWSVLKESLAIGWDTPNSYWMSGDQEIRPLTPSGADIDDSAYLRAAWAHKAVQAIGEHPLGLGFGRDGFGRAVERKYAFPGMVSSHSGWLDFALGAGLPGLALLLITAGLAILGGWKQFQEHDDGVGLMFCFLISGYLLRCLLDGHLSGWRLGLFAFICGVLIAAMKHPSRKV